MRFSTSSVQAMTAHSAEDLSKMREEFEEIEKKSSELNPHLRGMRNLLGYAMHELHDGAADCSVSGPLMKDVLTRVDQALAIVGGNVVMREGWLSDILDQLVRTQAFEHFLTKGELIRMSDPRLAGRVNDDEYLGGVMGLSHELARLAIKRASAMEVEAVVRCRDLLQSLNGKLLEFEFRNGNLRRKFDGVKWGVRRTEDLLYELSIVGLSAPPPPPGQEEARALVDLEELEQIRLRMVQFDERREYVIKTSRDIQKNSKQAIYAVHRGDTGKAAALLNSSKKLIEELLKDVEAHPTLRFGAFENALEEYGEAEIFRAWRAEGKLLSRADIGLVNSAEYVGALVDFTGEMGRYAVLRATNRDHDAVRACLETDSFINGELVRASLPSKLGKKMEALRTNQRKLETIMYELALVKAGKGVVGGTSITTDGPESSMDIEGSSGRDK